MTLFNRVKMKHVDTGNPIEGIVRVFFQVGHGVSDKQFDLIGKSHVVDFFATQLYRE